MSDEEAIAYLSKLRQIGRWSAEMILLFTYNRPNIWPLQDIGLLRAISNNYNFNDLSLQLLIFFNVYYGLFNDIIAKNYFLLIIVILSIGYKYQNYVKETF